MITRSTRLPPKRRRQRYGIERAPQRVWPRHRAWLRRHQCVVPNCQGGPIEIAHIRSAANAGTGLKPGDHSALPMCTSHHAEQHRAGMLTFAAKYGLDLAGLAAEFTRRSPDKAMREALRAISGAK
jgi:hypothetical protein